MTFTITLIAVAAALATFAGGLLALRLRDKLHLVLGFSAGAIIALAFFDLLPEALELGAAFHEPGTLLLWTALGFFGYVILDRFVMMHTHDDEHHHASRKRGIFGAGTLSGHSLLDGFAIGLAFQASPAIGAVVAAAVLAHDFSDGINTVNLVLKNGGSRASAFKWLAVDAVAPILGVAITFFIALPESALSLVLATFAGFFLYIGASDLLPESHHGHPKVLTTLLTLAGAGVMYAVVSIAG
jgi:ZIP family zinc transporter